MNRHDSYADIVQLYDLEHDSFSDDIDMLLGFAALGTDPILELGCGTGRVLVPLAQAGHVTIGIDMSPAMLAGAETRIAAHTFDHKPELIQGAMRDAESLTIDSFGMIIASLNSIMHLTTQEEQRSVIDSAHRMLLPAGRLIIDTLNPSLGQLNHLVNTTHLEGSWMLPDGSTLDKWSHRNPGEEPQTLDTLIWYDRLSADGNFTRTRTRFDLRFVHQSELALMLESAGFSYIDWYGSYDLDSWHPDAERLIAVAYKDDE